MTMQLRRRVTDRALRRQPWFWVGLVQVLLVTAVLVAVIVSTVADARANKALKDQVQLNKALAVQAKKSAAQAKALEAEVQGGVCRTFTFVAGIRSPDLTVQTLVRSTHDGALALHCPGVK